MISFKLRITEGLNREHLGSRTSRYNGTVAWGLKTRPPSPQATSSIIISRCYISVLWRITSSYCSTNSVGPTALENLSHCTSQALLGYMTDGKRWSEEDSILCSFYKCPFTPYPVLYVVSVIHFTTTTTTTPCDPQVAAHTQNFSVRLSERKRDTFSHTALFFSITPSLALDGKCTRGRGWGGLI